MIHYTRDRIRKNKYEGDSSEIKETQWYSPDTPGGVINYDPIKLMMINSIKYLHKRFCT